MKLIYVKKHTVSIADGQGSLELVNGNYNVTANVTGYDITSINPSNISIVEGTDDYKFYRYLNLKNNRYWR